MVGYDPHDPYSIESYARRLEGRRLRDCLSMEEQARYETLRGGKGGFGSLVERVYFGINPGNDPAPDFPDAGVELKVTPVVKRGGRLVSKERLVLGMIDYDSLCEEEWETSSLLQKARHLLLVFYEWKPDVSHLDYVVRRVGLWSIPDEDLPIIRKDWEKIRDKVRRGEAHLISEGDTLYLAACTKGSKGSDRRGQPHSRIPAKPRAFSLKASYMTGIVSDLGVTRSIVRTAGLRSGADVEEWVRQRFEKYAGWTADEIADRLGVTIQRGAKNFYAVLTKRILGASPQERIEEFEKADITVRTIRLRPSGVPEEDISFPAFDYCRLVDQNWSESDLRRQLTRRFFFVVYRSDSERGPVLEGSRFWTMPVEDLETCARECWEQTVERIRRGASDDLPRKSENRCVHVRPHGRNSADMVPTPSGPPAVRKSFWLNGRYVAEQLGFIA